jgi:hypothetical protein
MYYLVTSLDELPVALEISDDILQSDKDQIVILKKHRQELIDFVKKQQQMFESFQQKTQKDLQELLKRQEKEIQSQTQKQTTIVHTNKSEKVMDDT